MSSLGDGKINKILPEEVEIAKKLRSHIKNYDSKNHLSD
jgi:hypothetical protein